MRIAKRGFSTVEIIIVVVIIGILTTLGVVAFGRYRADANDSRRDAQLTTIADALEKYYQANGEYPGCTSMTQSPSVISNNVLVGLDTSLFKAPGSTLDNSFVCSTPTTTDSFGYVGTGSSCATGTACESYSLQYKTERDGSVASVTASSEVNNLSVTGGTLTSDATYYYRTFTTSGTLAITGGTLVADLLVIGGGGSGGSNMSGGGGAGGVNYATNQSLTGTLNVTVGNGGTPPANNSWLAGTNGENSSIGSVIAYGGGGGAGYSTAASNGGSGGGKGWATSTATGTAISGQGYPGGEGQSTGGGGAGGPGNNGDGNYWGYGGAGGTGTNAYASWAAVTGTGSSGYYAGGGAGNANYYGATSNGGGGGNGRVNGIANTGSGGAGGGYGYTQIGAGGSGIVIVRYTKSQIPTVATFAPIYSWDFTTQGNSGWTTSIYNSCSGGATVTWATTYYNVWSGDDGSRACYSSGSVNKTETINSTEKLVIYIDAQILNTAFQGLTMSTSPGLSTETRLYGDLTRKAIRLGLTDVNVAVTSVGFNAISFWANSGTLKTQGRVYLYGIYMAKQSQEAQLISFLTAKGLSVY